MCELVVFDIVEQEIEMKLHSVLNMGQVFVVESEVVEEIVDYDVDRVNRRVQLRAMHP
jgi:hypothetical protein